MSLQRAGLGCSVLSCSWEEAREATAALPERGFNPPNVCDGGNRVRRSKFDII